MATSESAHLRRTVANVLQQEAGRDADASTVAAAASRLYGRLVGQLTPLIGARGVDAIAARSLHLARREFPWLQEFPDSGDSDGVCAQNRLRLEQQDAATAAHAAVAVLATLVALLIALIGQGLIARLVQTAWSTQLPRGDEREESER
jgi:hypothetical protein